jgi:hypothetical protein
MKSLYLILFLFLAQISCVKSYEPEILKAPNQFLVVDGIINCSPGGVTTISLSRTRNLSDTFINVPELRALVLIESSNNSFALNEVSSGVYKSAPLNLNTNTSYRLRILTNSGDEYVSEYVPVQITPSIDSVSWQQDNETINISISTHDPQNESKYFKWEYEETWEYKAAYESILKFVNGQIQFRDSSEMTWRCWLNNASYDILTETTSQLSEDRIVNKILTSLPAKSPKLEIRYSIFVRQYSLSKAAYEFWEIVKKNSQQLGSLFDPQPSQLKGNLKNTKNDKEPVIGFVSASTINTERIFIQRGEIMNGHSPITSCTVLVVDPSIAPSYLLNPENVAAYYVSGGGVAITTKPCIDCRLQGGTVQKPSFW